MVYEGRRYYPRRRRSRVGAGRQSTKTAVRLTVCLWVLFLAVMLRLLFPAAVENVKDAVLEALGSHVNYTAAVQVLGDAVHDGKNIFAALYEACAYAFRPADEEIEAGRTDDADDPAAYDGIPVSDGVEDEALFGAVSAAVESGEDADTADATDPVALFTRSQADFAQLDLPNNVTYGMPALPVAGVRPVEGVLTSGFGYRIHPSDGNIRFHYGADVGAEEGSAVTAFADGTILAVGESTSYGNYVILEHDGGVETLYAHLRSVTASGGAPVSQGDKIGEVGATGNATSPCLHFELLIDGYYVNPEYYLNWENSHGE